MNCDQAKPLVHSYADGELDAAAVLDLERHIDACPGCGQALRNLQSLKKAIKQDTLYFTAPNELRRKMKANLRAEADPPPRWLFNFKWFPTALTMGLAACAILLVVNHNNSASTRLAQELVSGHIRSLMANHILDVVSTDQHTVKPWFNGKLDFSPPVKDLAAQEFPLIGGRLDYLEGHSVAALVFQHRKHIINLFVWPDAAKESPPAARAPMQGYNLIQWSAGGMAFWAVSDLNAQELLDFAQDYAR